MIQILRFAGVGGLATLAHVIAAFTAYRLAGLDPQSSNLVGFLLAFGISYLGNARWTFQAKGNDLIFLPKFLVVSLVGLVVSASVTALVTSLGYAYWIALIAVVLTVPPMTFLGAKFLVFDDADQETASLALPLGFAVAIVVWIIFSGGLINHDTAWYLVAARQWLGGQALYVDILEVNPPLGFYLTVPSIWLADFTGTTDSNAQIAIMAALTGLSVGWATKIVAQRPDASVGRVLAFAALAAVALTLPFSTHFAQREHIMVALILPWLAGEAVKADQQSQRSVILRSAVAALGICLKPFFLAYPLFVTLYAVCKSRSLRPVFAASNLTMGLVGFAYVVFVYVLHPAYFTEIIPSARLTYAAYGFDASVVLEKSNILLAVLALGVASLARTAPVLVLAVLAAALAYVLQWTGFTYQAAPILVFAILATGWGVLFGTGRLMFIPAAVFAGLITVHVVEAGRYWNSIATVVAPQILDKFGPGAKIAVWSTELTAGFPLVLEARGEWMLNAPALWYLPGALPALHDGTCSDQTERCARLQRLVDETRGEMRATLVCADVLVLDRQMTYLADKGFSLDDIYADPAELAHALVKFDPVIQDSRIGVFFRKQRCI